MNVYVVETSKDDGGKTIEVFTREGAIKLSRRAWRQAFQNKEDTRSDQDALDDFMVTHWAIETKLLEG